MEDVDKATTARLASVRELTVAEVRDWLRALATPPEEAEIDLADWLLYQDEGLRVSDFARLTDLSIEAVQALTPSQLDAILARAKELNPRFFSALGRVLAMGRMSLQAVASTTSNAPAPKSPNWFTRTFGRGHGAG